MLKLGRVAKVKVLFLVLVFVFILAYSNVFEFSAAILEKGLLLRQAERVFAVLPSGCVSEYLHGRIYMAGLAASPLTIAASLRKKKNPLAPRVS